MRDTPDLSKEFHPMPKPPKKDKKTPQPLKAGKKTKAWNDARAIIKRDFEERGITKCEIKRAGCWVNNALTFAHIDKRVNLKYPEDLYMVVLACTPCHQALELGPVREMKKTLLLIIKNRED